MLSFERHRKNVEHATWRVEHVTSLLDLHRSLRADNEDWREKGRVLMERQEDAKRTLAALIAER